MKYTVSVAIDGRIDVEVEADSFERAKYKAILEVGGANLNTMEFISLNPVNAEDENGDFVDY
jgi:hypothetical protein